MTQRGMLENRLFNNFAFWFYSVICLLIVRHDLKQSYLEKSYSEPAQRCLVKQQHCKSAPSKCTSKLIKLPSSQSFYCDDSPESYVVSDERRTHFIEQAAAHNIIPGAYAFEETERIKLRDEAKQMFYHAYRSYLSTYPADEVLPISCRGRYNQGQDNGEIDDAIGNFSLTLVDSLDTLVMLGDFNEFEIALRKVIKDLNFDTDIIVSVFETNIRMLGGLLSAHMLAKSIQDDSDRNIRYVNNATRQKLNWYKREMLDLAEDLGTRLLPAFKTKTGIPHSRVNLKHGMEFRSSKTMYETCTACAGSLILEFATLSRLTGNPIFEQKARKALDSIWDHRHKSTDLVGTVLNVDSGEWVRRESGVGAGSDSYYEYLLKAYILLGDSIYLDRFNKHYRSVMNYISRGPFLIDVHMHRPNRAAKGFMDALSAFWPGLQVLKGDLRSAVDTHNVFNEVIRRHSYLPEAFTTDLQVYWANHQMRPEFLESTYFLYKATKDDHYLETGREIMKKLQRLKVGCGFAGLKDVRTGVHDDRMASFVLAETLKYLYLLFSADNETYVDLDRFIFSTEGHLLPIDLSLKKLTTELQETNIDNLKSLDKFERRSALPTRAEIENVLIQVSDSIDPHDLQKIFRAIRWSKSVEKKAKSGKKKKSVILKTASDYSNSCPSLEIQDMRFNRRYHPFLNKDLLNLDETEDNAGTSYEKGKSKKTVIDDDKPEVMDINESSSLQFMSVSMLPNGAIRVTVDPSSKPSESKQNEQEKQSDQLNTDSLGKKLYDLERDHSIDNDWPDF